jgi:hypothetical protein
MCDRGWAVLVSLRVSLCKGQVTQQDKVQVRSAQECGPPTSASNVMQPTNAEDHGCGEKGENNYGAGNAQHLSRKAKRPLVEDDNQTIGESPQDYTRTVISSIYSTERESHMIKKLANLQSVNIIAQIVREPRDCRGAPVVT